eukprot:SAG11_NODE_3141_length_2658_cov_1.249707_1_plen_139_part_00
MRAAVFTANWHSKPCVPESYAWDPRIHMVLGLFINRTSSLFWDTVDQSPFFNYVDQNCRCWPPPPRIASHRIALLCFDLRWQCSAPADRPTDQSTNRPTGRHTRWLTRRRAGGRCGRSWRRRFRPSVALSSSPRCGPT